MKTPISYYGGKQRMLPEIMPLIPEHNVYCEPFFGGGAVFFSKKQVENETINDINNIVVTFYEMLQRNFLPLKKRILSTTYSRYHFNQAQNILKRPSKNTKTSVAWAFWVVSNFSWGNKIGGGLKYSNSPKTRVDLLMRNKKLAFTEDLKKRIETTCIENRDAIEVINSRDTENTFYFIDPPYQNADQGQYRGYTKNDLINLLNTLTRLKGFWMLTQYPSELLTEFVADNHYYFRGRMIKNAGMRKNNLPKVEAIICNYPLNQMQMAFDEEYKNVVTY